MIYFKKIIIKNFMAIGEAEIDLTQTGFTLISAENHRVEDASGSNGSGKSSILEALVFCLTGETIRGFKEVINRFTTGDLITKVFFEFKGQNWAIERGMTRSKEKSLVIERNGEILPSKGYRDSEEVLQKELPELTFKFLNSVVVLGQGLPGRFTNNTPSGRKAVLEELTNADFMITQIKENIKRRGLELNRGLREAEDNVLSGNSRIEVYQKEIERMNQDLTTLQSHNLESDKKDLEELVNIGKKLSLEYDELSKKVEEFLSNLHEIESKESSLKSELENKVKQEKDNYFKVKSDILSLSQEKFSEASKEINSHIQEVNLKLIKAVEEISHHKNKIEGGVCKYCGQKLLSIRDEELENSKNRIEELNQEKSKYHLELEGLNSELSNLKLSLKNNSDKLILDSEKVMDQAIEQLNLSYNPQITDLKNLRIGAQSNYESLTKQKSDKYSELSDLRVKYQTLKNSIDSYLQQVENLKQSITDETKDLEDIKNIVESEGKKAEDFRERLKVNKSMETFASRDFRGILLEGVINRLDLILKGYAQIIYGNQLTSFYLDGNSIQVEFDGKEYESLSGGEQQKLNLILQLSLRDLIIELTGVTGSILMLDECFDGLDSVGCSKIIELVQSLDTSTWIITHRKEELAIPYDQSLIVIKNPNGVSEVQLGV